MELRPGYKQTEVGVIPEDWEIVCLSELVTAGPKNGYSGRCGKESRGTPTLSLGATTPGHLMLNDDTVKRLDETIDTRSDLYLKPGDVLVQRSNTADLVGTTAVFDGPAGVYVYPDLMMRMRFRDDATAHWFWRYANSASGRRFFISIAAGSSGSMPKISGEKLRMMVLPSPPLPEQRAITAALSDVDALISGLDRLIAKKRDLKQAAMQQLLTGKQRLPGFCQKPGYKQTDLGVMPEDWEEANLGEKTIKVGSGITPTGGARVYKQSGHPFLRSQNVGWGFLLLDDVAFIDDDTHESFSATEIEVGDVFLNITGASIGRSAVADSRVLGGNVNQHVCIIRPKNSELDPNFLNQFLLSRVGQRQIDSFQAGGNRQGLNFGQIRSFRLPLPPIPEQTAIATVLADMDDEIAALEQRRDKTRALKQGMMQELLTGRIRMV